jgi:hypothetical protein
MCDTSWGTGWAQAELLDESAVSDDEAEEDEQPDDREVEIDSDNKFVGCNSSSLCHIGAPTGNPEITNIDIIWIKALTGALNCALKP